MKKKSILGLLLLLFMVMLAVSACGQQDAESPAPDSTVQGVQETGQETGEDPAETGEEAVPEVAGEKETPEETEGSLQAKEKPAPAGESGQESPAPPKNPESPENLEKTEKKNLITLQVTRDFGAQVVSHKKVELQKDWTILDLLKANLEIETDLDGEFINGINGLKTDKGGLSGKRTDWFYYVNGICADMGADAYRLQGGETVWWDYHLWESMGSAISAVIGSYPEPFIHGYGGKTGGTTVMHAPEKVKLGEKLKKALEAKGVKTVTLSGIEEDVLKKRKGPVLVIGEWPELNQVKWLQDFNKAYRKTGTGVHFTDQGLELIQYNGEVDREVSGSAGVIIATGSGLGDEAPLWIVGGTDEKGLDQAVNLLADHPEKISGMYGAALESGKIVRLPVQPD